MFSHEFRGKKRVHEDEKKRLDKLGGKILRETGLDFEEIPHYGRIMIGFKKILEELRDMLAVIYENV